MSAINLGDCEQKLKEKYNTPKNENLYIIKIDINLEGMKIPKIEYEVFYQLYDNSLSKLDLSIYKNTQINIAIPIDISLNEIDKYNSSSRYYNDLCYTLTTDNESDITFRDRQKEFINNNMTVCEENFIFINYDYDINKVVCSC